MISTFFKVVVITLFLSCLQGCSQLLAPNEIMIDSLLSESKIIDLLTKQEWLNYKYFDPYTLGLPSQGNYSSGTDRVLHLGANGRFSETTNSVSPTLKAQGRWRFIKTQKTNIASFQKEDRYKRIIQGELILLDSIGNPQRFMTTTIDTIKSGHQIVFVSNLEFFQLIPSHHGFVSWYYKAK